MRTYIHKNGQPCRIGMYVQKIHAEARKIIDKSKRSKKRKAMLGGTIMFQLKCSEHMKTCESCFTCQSPRSLETLSSMPKRSDAFRMQ